MRAIGLYYPYIHFRNDVWLKAAALYWPGMARIVPGNYMPSDTDVARELNDELGFIIDVNPAPAASAVADFFIRAIREQADRLHDGLYIDREHVDETIEDIAASRESIQFDTSNDELVLSDAHLIPPEKYSEDRPDDLLQRDQLTGLLYGEVDDAVREVLFEAGLAMSASLVPTLRKWKSAHDVSHDWMVVHPDLAWVYKCVLSREVARQNQLQPTTDQVASQSAAQDWSSDEIAVALLQAGSVRRGSAPSKKQLADEGRRAELQERLAFLALRIALPANLYDVPTKKIIKIRQKYKAEFDAFGDLMATTVDDIIGQLGEVREQAVLDAYLRHEVERRFERPVADLRKAMRGIGLDSVLSAVNLKLELPAAVATAGAGLVAGQPLIAGAGAAAFGLLGVARNARQVRAEKLAQSSVSYLLRVRDTWDTGIAPTMLIQRILDRIAKTTGR